VYSFLKFYLTFPKYFNVLSFSPHKGFSWIINEWNCKCLIEEFRLQYVRIWIPRLLILRVRRRGEDFGARAD